MVGQDKLLIAPRDPTSLVQVSSLPLAGAGNLWIWVPQARYEERVRLSDTSGMTLQSAVVQTSETLAEVDDQYTKTLRPSRPGVEGRVGIWHTWGNTNRVELASGIHKSTTHVAGAGLPSFLYSFDGLLRPSPWLEVTGTYFSGENLANLSGPVYGFAIPAVGQPRSLRARGGWLQTAFPITSRLTLNAFGGYQGGNAASPVIDQFQGASAWSGNFIYRLGPNVLVSAEAGQYRYQYSIRSAKILNHYDLALGYSF
jgi:hypothetical protein